MSAAVKGGDTDQGQTTPWCDVGAGIGAILTFTVSSGIWASCRRRLWKLPGRAVRSPCETCLMLLNRGVSLPNAAVAVAHRADASGTSFVFTSYLAKVSKEWKEKVGAATSVSWPTGTGRIWRALARPTPVKGATRVQDRDRSIAL